MVTPGKHDSSYQNSGSGDRNTNHCLFLEREINTTLGLSSGSHSEIFDQRMLERRHTQQKRNGCERNIMELRSRTKSYK